MTIVSLIQFYLRFVRELCFSILLCFFFNCFDFEFVFEFKFVAYELKFPDFEFRLIDFEFRLIEVEFLDFERQFLKTLNKITNFVKF